MSCRSSNFMVLVRVLGVGLKNFKDVNVLENEQVRDGVKKFSNWPTIPQLYVKGVFIGGSDIVKEMHQDGSLEELLKREKVL